jgi:hypothetical protein
MQVAEIWQAADEIVVRKLETRSDRNAVISGAYR